MFQSKSDNPKKRIASKQEDVSKTKNETTMKLDLSNSLQLQ